MRKVADNRPSFAGTFCEFSPRVGGDTDNLKYLRAYVAGFLYPRQKHSSKAAIGFGKLPHPLAVVVKVRR
jgi:hypothetical protein